MSATPTQIRFSQATSQLNAVQTQLLEEISYHTQESFRLKALLNSRQPISQLPPEILVHIFLLQADAFQQENLLHRKAQTCCGDKPPVHKPLYTWTSVALVCHHWRQVALKSQQLWTCLALDERVSATYIRTILSRSHGAPLTVVIHAVSKSHCAGCAPDRGPEQNHLDAQGLLAEVLPITRRLSVFVGTKDYANICNTLCSSASQLEWLHIEAIGRFADMWSSETRALSLPQGLFTPGIPPLRTLSVSTIEFDWDSALLLPTLRHLKVLGRKSSDANPQAPAALPLSHLLDVLRGLSQLESLELDETSTPKHDPSTQCNSVALPHLRLLYLSLASANTSHLISHLRIPKTATIHLEEPPESPKAPRTVEQSTIETQQQFIIDVLEGMVVLGIATRLPRSAFYETRRRPTCCIWAENTGSEDSLSASPSSWDNIEPRPPRLVLESHLGAVFLDRIFAALDLRHLRVLSIEDVCDSPPRWSDTLRRAENMTMMDITGMAAFGLGAALVGWTRPASMDAGRTNRYGHPIHPSAWVGFAEVADDTLHFTDVSGVRADGGGEAAGALSVRFPRLRVVRISRLDFRLTRPMTREQRWRYRTGSLLCDITYDATETPYGLDVEGLARSLRLRPEHCGTRLDRLEFVGCQCHERERLVPLLAAVDELWWDGRRLTEADLPPVRVRKSSTMSYVPDYQ